MRIREGQCLKCLVISPVLVAFHSQAEACMVALHSEMQLHDAITLLLQKVALLECEGQGI